MRGAAQEATIDKDGGQPMIRAGLRFLAKRLSRLLVPFTAVCLALLTPVALTAVVLWLMGWRLQPVETPSMAPLYPSGSLVAVQPIDASQVEPGMVIVFENPAGEGLIAHRVVAQLPGDVPIFRTRGDRNIADDPYPVFPEDIRGRVRWGIPGVGHVVSALNSWWGATLLIGLPGGLLIATESYDLYRRRRGGAGREPADDNPATDDDGKATDDAAATDRVPVS